MKDASNILWAVFMAVLMTSVAYLINKTIEQQKENNRLSENLEQYGRQVSILQLTKKELKHELEKREKTIVAVDSILRQRNLRISQLERLIATRIVIIDRDTTFLPLEKAVPVYLPTPSNTAQLYKSVFKTAGNCISIEGFILSTDPDPSLAITDKTVQVTVYNMDVKRRWYQFWKPKTQKVLSSECGTVEVLEVNTTN